MAGKEVVLDMGPQGHLDVHPASRYQAPAPPAGGGE